MQKNPLIVVVGVCASGKTTLSLALKELGYNVRSFAQEHSVSGRMWRRLKPDVLIFLECSLATIRSRKQISWGERRYAQQQKLLEDARKHADFIIATDGFSPAKLVNVVSTKLLAAGIEPAT